MTPKRWMWGVLAGVVLLVGLLLFSMQVRQNRPADFNIEDPNVIAVVQGVEDSFEGLEIGVTFVDNVWARISLYSDAAGGSAEYFSINEGDTITYEGYEVELLDAQAAIQSAVFRIDSNK